MKALKKFLYKLLFLPLLWLLYFVSKLIPKKKNLWVIGSYNDTFTDNSKYFYLYVLKKHPEIEVIWITNNSDVEKYLKSLNYPVKKRWSLKGLWISLRAYVYIYSSYISDINFWTSNGALKLNLWHGIPLKVIEHDIKIGKLKRKYNSFFKIFYKVTSPWLFTKPDFLLSTSWEISKIFSQAFRIDIKNCINFGYPRCDIFLKKNSYLIKEFKDDYMELLKTINKYKKIIIYMPTFRDNFKYEAISNIDLNSLNEFLEKNNYLLIFKSHPNVTYEVNKSLKNVLIWDNRKDIYPLLRFSNLLITDYSSIMFDYLLLKKPILLFWYDIEHYSKNERGFYKNVFNKILNYIDVAYTEKDLYEKILYMLNNDIDYKGYTELIKYFWENYDFNANQKIYSFLTELKK